jgi:SAM-dependent methyltransferase
METSTVNRDQEERPRPLSGIRPAMWSEQELKTETVVLDRHVPEFYDLEYADRIEDIGFYQRMAFEANDPVLELACATGRLAIPLARIGAQIVGLDHCAAMLEICRAKRDRLLAVLKGRLELVEDDMRCFSLGREFRLIIAAFDSFSALKSLPEQDACLAAAARHLADGGRLVVDMAFPDPTRLAPNGPNQILERTFHWPQGRTIVTKYRRTWINMTRQEIAVVCEYRYQDRNARLTRRFNCFTSRLVFPYEMPLLLERHGLAVKAVFGSHDMEPLVEGSTRMIFVAEK